MVGEGGGDGTTGEGVGDGGSDPLAADELSVSRVAAFLPASGKAAAWIPDSGRSSVKWSSRSAGRQSNSSALSSSALLLVKLLIFLTNTSAVNEFNT